jgi:hypothetical protein
VAAVSVAGTPALERRCVSQAVHGCGYEPLKARSCLQACAHAQDNGLTSTMSGTIVRVQRAHDGASTRRAHDSEIQEE